VNASPPEPQPPSQKKQELLAKEAKFWDLQEDKIEALYARPHDWRFVPHLAEIIIRPRVKTFLRLLDTHKSEIKSLIDIGCGNGWSATPPPNAASVRSASICPRKRSPPPSAWPKSRALRTCASSSPPT
jgi:hypothetical protein